MLPPVVIQVCVVWPRPPDNSDPSEICSASRYCPCTRLLRSQFVVTIVPIGAAALLIGIQLPDGSSGRPFPFASYQYMNWARIGIVQPLSAPAVIEVEIGCGTMPLASVTASPNGPGEVASQTKLPSHTTSFWKGLLRLFAVAKRNWNGVFSVIFGPPTLVASSICIGIS